MGESLETPNVGTRPRKDNGSPSLRAALDDERTRSAVVLMYDIRGFSSAARRVPEREFAAFIAGAHAHVLSLFRDPEPTFVKNLGDGCMLLWEADPPRAITALRQIVPACVVAQREYRAFVGRQSFRGREHLPTDLGFGVTFGTVTRRDDWYGHAINCAARLQDQARPRGVIVDEATYGLVPELGAPPFDEPITRHRRRLKGVGTVHYRWIARLTPRERWRWRISRLLVPLVVGATIVFGAALGLAFRHRAAQSRAQAVEDVELRSALRLASERLEAEDPRGAAAAFARLLDASGSDPERELHARLGLAVSLERLPRAWITLGHLGGPIQNLEATERFVAANARPAEIARFDLDAGTWDRFSIPLGQRACRGVGLGADGGLHLGLAIGREPAPGGVSLVVGPCVLHRAPPGSTTWEEVRQTTSGSEIGSALGVASFDVAGPKPFALSPDGQRLAALAPGGEIAVYRAQGSGLELQALLAPGANGAVEAIRLEFLDADHLVAEIQGRDRPDAPTIHLWTDPGRASSPTCRVERARWIGSLFGALLVQRDQEDETVPLDTSCREAGRAPFSLARASLPLGPSAVVSASGRLTWLRRDGGRYDVPEPPGLVAFAAPASGRFLAVGTREGEVAMLQLAPYAETLAPRHVFVSSAAPRWLAFAPDGERLAIEGSGVVELATASLDTRRFPALTARAAHYVRATLWGIDHEGRLLRDDGAGEELVDGFTTCGDRVALVRGEQIIVVSPGERVAPGQDGFGRADVVSADRSCSTVLALYPNGDLTAFRNQRFTRESAGIGAAAVAPSGRFWVQARKTRIEAIDAGTRRALWSGEHGALITAIAVDPRTEAIVTGDAEGHVTLWTPTGNRVARFRDTFGVSAIAFDPNGTRLAVAGTEGEVVIHDLGVVGEERPSLVRRARCASGLALREGALGELAWSEVVGCIR